VVQEHRVALVVAELVHILMQAQVVVMAAAAVVGVHQDQADFQLEPPHLEL
jgi:hypothetical protein